MRIPEYCSACHATGYYISYPKKEGPTTRHYVCDECGEPCGVVHHEQVEKLIKKLQAAHREEIKKRDQAFWNLLEGTLRPLKPLLTHDEILQFVKTVLLVSKGEK